ncbi:phosphoribosylanthranilate isomerase [Flagellimonas allohymeniacidonis]|uniref:N-(5'-phosphoribosyl)anthranilate isomerase n=1 Tax=Flagellimonas allohymeniacidonis TaxID=2517819 RepID=A0A4V2HS80_9FLAO|nr:phosphoribosylanthranilate isomerase [Allomuricauda hymeniacidonis]TAI46730.1 phosphoribosylanthranilate isomerase [Allomuricauda hymeniacidonis]
MKLKVCGMKYNPKEVAELQPNYLGFIFWEPSSRYFEGRMPELPSNIKKIGVFVDAPLEEVRDKVKKYNLDGVQLHGNETPDYCERLRHAELVSASHDGVPEPPLPKRQQVRNDPLEIIKVFSMKDEFDFSTLTAYEEVCDYFLFDTKGKLPGGNGYTFDWSILVDYPSTKPFFLSGGIGLEEVEKLKLFLESPASTYCHAIDVNSRFETKPGLKNIEKLSTFKKLLFENESIKTENP